MTPTSPHIVTAFEEALKRLRASIVQMAGAAESQLDQALDCLIQRKPELARAIAESDAQLDGFEQEIEANCMRLLVLRNPVADDLRQVIAALKIAGNLERIGDHAANSARRAAALAGLPNAPATPGALNNLGRLVRERLTAVINAYVDGDVAAALEVWRSDDEVDALYTSLSDGIMTAAETQPVPFAPNMHLLFIAKSLERIGDHATNIAEVVHFLHTGKPLLDERPKADRTADGKSAQ